MYKETSIDTADIVFYSIMNLLDLPRERCSDLRMQPKRSLFRPCLLSKSSRASYSASVTELKVALTRFDVGVDC